MRVKWELLLANAILYKLFLILRRRTRNPQAYVLDNWFQRDGKLAVAYFTEMQERGAKDHCLLLLFLPPARPAQLIVKTMNKHWPHLMSQSMPQGSVMGAGWGSRSHLWSETVSWSDSRVQTGFRFRSPRQGGKKLRESSLFQKLLRLGTSKHFLYWVK